MTKSKREKWKASQTWVCLKMGRWELGGKEPRTGHSSHSCWLTRKKDGREIRQSGTGFGFNPAVRWYDEQGNDGRIWEHRHLLFFFILFFLVTGQRLCPHTNHTLKGAVCYHTVSHHDVTAQPVPPLPSFRTDWFIHSLLKQNSLKPGASTHMSVF